MSPLELLATTHDPALRTPAGARSRPGARLRGGDDPKAAAEPVEPAPAAESAEARVSGADTRVRGWAIGFLVAPGWHRTEGLWIRGALVAGPGAPRRDPPA